MIHMDSLGSAGDDGERQQQGERQYVPEQQTDQTDPEAADIGLPFTADVEQAGVEGHRHRQTGEDETGGVIEGEAYPLRWLVDQ